MLLGTTFGLLFAIITGITFVVSAYTNWSLTVGAVVISPAIIGLVLAALFLTIQFLVSPWIMDLQLSWLYKIHWGNLEVLPPEMAEALQGAMNKHGFTLAKIGIIEDETPNAFTYGRFTKNARMVFTRGIITLLDPEERVAVLEHEVGHIVNKDFIFMTLAQAIPLLLYMTYITSREAGAQMARTSDNNTAKGIGAAFIGVAVLSFIFYWLSEYFVYLLSRTREYLADHFSVFNTNNPNALSSALVKVAYGLVLADANIKRRLNETKGDSKENKKEITQMKRKQNFWKGMKAMGLADSNTASSLVMQAYARSPEVSADAVAAAATWDLSTPWAKVVELTSTHPLTGKRLVNIDSLAIELNLPQKYPALGSVKPEESLWDDFLIDIFVMFASSILSLILLAGIGALSTFFTIGNPFIGAGVGVIIFTFLYYWKTNLTYPNLKNWDNPSVSKNTVFEAVSSVERDGYIKASPVRSKPIVLEGVIIGKGNPGYMFSEDFVIRDESGIMKLDIRSILGGLGNFISSFKVGSYIEQKARVVGWYQRSMMPYVIVNKVYLEDGRVVKIRQRGLHQFYVGLLLAIGLVLLVL